MASLVSTLALNLALNSCSRYQTYEETQKKLDSRAVSRETVVKYHVMMVRLKPELLLEWIDQPEGTVAKEAAEILLSGPDGGNAAGQSLKKVYAGSTASGENDTTK